MTREGSDEWPVRLRSPRLLIREPMDPDREAMIRLMTHPVTREYLGGSIDYASRQALELSPLGLTWGRWVLVLEGADGADGADGEDEVIGSITLDYDRGELQLSYALMPERTGQGFAAESCLAVLGWACEALEDDTVIAVTQTRNKRSVALLRRLGFSVRKGLEEFGAQQLLMERSLRDPLPEPGRPLQPASDPPPPSA
ncbi:GNAT family N-acetyltransferase [Brachybacterium sp. DNPG3]